MLTRSRLFLSASWTRPGIVLLNAECFRSSLIQDRGKECQKAIHLAKRQAPSIYTGSKYKQTRYRRFPSPLNCGSANSSLVQHSIRPPIIPRHPNATRYPKSISKKYKAEPRGFETQKPFGAPQEWELSKHQGRAVKSNNTKPQTPQSQMRTTACLILPTQVTPLEHIQDCIEPPRAGRQLPTMPGLSGFIALTLAMSLLCIQLAHPASTSTRAKSDERQTAGEYLGARMMSQT